MIIKTAYKYYDEDMKLWNLFIFVEFCSIYFCIHRVRKNLKYLTDETYYNIDYIESSRNQIFTYDVVYIYESNDFINESIYELKKNFGKKIRKQNITKTLYKTIRCFACISCNFHLYILSCAYNENSENIIKNGIYADYKKIYSEDDVQILKDLMEDCEKVIIRDSKSLASKINQLIESKYDFSIFLSQCELEHSRYYCQCDIEDCKVNYFNRCNNENFYICYDCYSGDCGKYETIYSNLCYLHYNQENIQKHKDIHKNGKINNNYVIWTDEILEHYDRMRIEKMMNNIQ